jgi:hypothetical protein
VSYIFNAQSYIGSSRSTVNATDQRVYKHAQDKIMQAVQRINTFYNSTWKDYRSAMEKVSLSPFKDYPELKLNSN